MEDTFEKRVRAAANAAWWTILVGLIFLAFQWIAYLIVMAAHPALLLRLWGPETTWPFVQTVWFFGIAVFKLFLGMLALVALWLTVWAQQLRKQMPGQ
jgi:hypothetical protein